jgi:hypothetical protein
MVNFETEPMKSMLKSMPRPCARLLVLAGGVVMLSDRLPATTYTWVPTLYNGRWNDKTAYWSHSNLVSSTSSDVFLTNGSPGTNGANTVTGAASFDGVNVGGNLNIASGSIFQIVLGTSGSQTNSFWDTGRAWSGVFNVTGTKSGAFDTFKVVDSSFNPVTISSPGSFSFDSSTGSLSWAAVPEPTSALVGLLIGAGGLRRRRKCSAAR